MSGVRPGALPLAPTKGRRPLETDSFVDGGLGPQAPAESRGRASGLSSLLEIDRLRVEVASAGAPIPLLDDVSLSLGAGEILGLVGESGCGKSVTALSVLRLLPEPPTRVAGGTIRFEDEVVGSLSRRRLQALRGSRIGMIFQEPMSSLNPTFTVGWQIAEAVRLHTGLRGAALSARVRELLALVGIGAPERRLAQYQHELSGGLRQRVMIAIALAADPALLIADEPTTALDVTVQRQVLDLISRLRRERGMAVLLITHDLGVISGYADRVCVMYAGLVVETAPASALFAAPRHPYTAALLAARPRLSGPRGRLAAIPGSVPPSGHSHTSTAGGASEPLINSAAASAVGAATAVVRYRVDAAV